jgi:hypothetical protein
MSALKFDAVPRTKLTISVTKRGNEPLPSGELIIAGSWWNTKDKLVGISLDEELRNVATFAIVSGSAVILLAGVLTLRRLA